MSKSDTIVPVEGSAVFEGEFGNLKVLWQIEGGEFRDCK